MGLQIKKNLGKIAIASALAIGGGLIYIQSDYVKEKDIEWSLVWGDEFNYQGAPDENKWYIEEGCGIRNEELQCYTKDEKNVRVENGNLIIEGRNEDNIEYPYSSSSLLTRWPNFEKSITFKYGRFEMRAILPDGKGVWPAFWMTGHGKGVRPWPACGEIDIFEYIGRQPNILHTTIHWESPEGKHLRDKTEKKFNPSEFNTYAIEWDEEKIKFFLNGKHYYTYSNNKADDGDYNPFKVPHIIRLNFAIGGSWGGEVDSTIFPQYYIVDYVRVYQKRKAIKYIPAISVLLLN